MADRATLSTVAARAGVSPSTASLAFAGSHRVAPATVERVLRAADELGYAGPNPVAASTHRRVIDAFVSDWTRQHTREDLMKLCEDAQVPCGPILSIEDAFADPQYAARENILFAQDPRAGEVAVPNTVPRLTGTPGGVEWLGPPLGAHNAEIYGGLLGVPDDELLDLARRGVI